MKFKPGNYAEFDNRPPQPVWREFEGSRPLSPADWQMLDDWIAKCLPHQPCASPKE
jgi:hypothetical protein